MSIERLTAAVADRYRVERVLGIGGMATVYLAEDLKHHRQIAIKVMQPELAATLGADRFLREVEIAAKLSHPNIVPVYDSGSADGLLYYVMPLVEGESLEGRLLREKQLPVGDAMRIARETADALAYAHARGVVHRDIKPANILLNAGHAMVADFGIARATSGLAGAALGLTQTGFAVGTPQYMSPEQSIGDANVDGRTDVYALGCVLYEMLSGEPPFTGPTPQAVIARSITDTARPLQQTRPSLSPAISAVVSTAMSKTPADRYATAADFATALGDAENQSRAPSGLTVVAPASARARRWPVVAAIAIAAVAVVVVGMRYFARTAGASTVHSVAVLPFTNAGPTDQAYFADGIVDELRDKLARIDQLRVIASASADQYRQSTKSGTQIAEELRVDQLLMGKVSWGRGASDTRQVRVVTELVNGETGAVTWRQSFDADSAGAFAIQGRIATAVAAALGTSVKGNEAKNLAGRPTQNNAAYDAYLKATALRGNSAVVSRSQANLYEQAVALDSMFARAWGGLAVSLSLQYANGTRDADVARRAKQAVDHLLKLANDSSGAHVVAADYYRIVEGNRAASQRATERALALDSNNVSALMSASIIDFDNGNAQRAFRLLERARTIDPRSRGVLINMTKWLQKSRRYDEALVSARELNALGPTSPETMEDLMKTYLAAGDTAGARTALQSFMTRVPVTEAVAYFAGYYEMAFLLSSAERELLFRLTPAAFDNDRAWWAQSLATAARQQGNVAMSRAYADSALALSKRQSDDLPNDSQLRVLYAVMLSYVGRAADATREAERAVAALQAQNPGDVNLAYIRMQAARVYLANGQHDKAIDELEKILASTSDFSPGYLRVEPTFKVLRGNLRFEKLLGGPRV